LGKKEAFLESKFGFSKEKFKQIPGKHGRINLKANSKAGMSLKLKVSLIC
jgi:hypothetical protein